MPLHFFYLNRRSLFTVFSLVFAVIFITSASPVHADPHAVFYTDRAQEQLFYNVLAALNQADYVEPGIPGSPYSRTSLVQNRAIAADPIPGQSLTPFNAEANPVINSTHTNLPSVVTRNITLEGNDLWTSYLLQQFALETATRRSENELARVYCDRGLGIIGCDINSPYAVQGQSKSFVTDPNSLTSSIAIGQDAILRSGTQDEQAARNYIATQDETTGHKPGDPPSIPRPDSPELSALNKNIEKNNQSIGATALNTIASSITTPTRGIDPNTFTDVQVQNGEVKLASTVDSADKYLDKLQQIANLPAQLMSVAQDGANKQEAFLNNLTNTPSLADFRLSQNKGTGGLDATFTTPSSARLSAQQALANAEANAGINQHFANPNAVNQPGDTNLVLAPAPAQNPLPATFPDNLVALNLNNTANSPQLALNPSPAPQQGQVAGITSDIYNLYNNVFGAPPEKALSPSVNAINPVQETGLRDGLVALTNNTYRKDGTGAGDANCAFCMQMSTILNNAQGQIGGLYCALFPKTSACVERNPIISPAPTI